MHKMLAKQNPLDLGTETGASEGQLVTMSRRSRVAAVRSHYSPRAGSREAQIVRLGVHRQCGRAATALRATYPASTRRKATNWQEVGIPRIPPTG